MSSLSTASPSSTHHPHLWLVPTSGNDATGSEKSLFDALDDICWFSRRLDFVIAAMHEEPTEHELVFLREALVVWTLRINAFAHAPDRARVIALSLHDLRRLVTRIRPRLAERGIRLKHRADRLSFEYALHRGSAW